MMSETVLIFDTTLRDGEQSPGASMTLGEKLRIATTLEAMGVDIIESGFPAASAGDFEAVAIIAQTLKTSRIAALARAKTGDIESAGAALRGASGPTRIHTFLATSPLHMKHKLSMTPDQVLSAITDSVTLARSLVDDVEWSAEDAVRSDRDFLFRAVETAIKAGARTINIPDTVGYAMPTEYGALIAAIKNNVPNIDLAVISTHCHNDLGLAVANSLAGVQNGARQIECTINGLGERAGNAAMEEIVMAMKTRPDLLPYRINIDTTHIMRASRLVSGVTGFVVQPNKAIVGANAFAHESGIHQDGMLKNAQTYEIMTPESVGLSRSSLVMGKHSGRAALRDKLSALGYRLSDEELSEAFTRFKAIADKKKQIFDEDLIALVDAQMGQADEAIRLHSLSVTCGTTDKPDVRMSLSINGQIQETQSTGTGPVDATFRAIAQLVPHQATLQLYQVQAVTQGTDAQAEVTVRLEQNGTTAHGSGANIDTLAASAEAYLQALNKLQAKVQRIGRLVG
jgi:2-isopropylmalate synthase